MINTESKLVDKQTIEHAFLKLTHRYGNAWKTLFTNKLQWEDGKKEWFKFLQIIPENVFWRAFDASLFRYRDYPPNLAQIMSLCFHELGVPDFESVMSLVNRQDYSDPIAYKIYQKLKLGSFDNKMLTESEVRKRASMIFDDCVNEFIHETLLITLNHDKQKHLVNE